MLNLEVLERVVTSRDTFRKKLVSESFEGLGEYLAVEFLSGTVRLRGISLIVFF
jgi:hypothetical protein